MRPRVALYSHDAQGMGHMRRNLAIARTLAAGGCEALLVCGIRLASALPMPAGVQCVTLPALCKSTDGAYRSRLPELSLPRLIRVRAEILRTVLESFEPDALIADKYPLGICRELEPGVELLRGRGRTRFVLGLRDVLDEPSVVRREWARDGTAAAIAAHYDAVWIYGDRGVYDPVAEYAIEPLIADKVRYEGYLGAATARPATNGHPDAATELGLPPGRLALCLLGGGQDGADLAESFARGPLPPGMTGVVVAGPFMPKADRARLHALAARRPRLRVLDFVADLSPLLARADAVVAMGGYNTLCELLARGIRPLIVPRVVPRREQLIRARRLAERGLVDLLHPRDLEPAAIGGWLAGAAGAGAPERGPIDLDGLARISGFLVELLTSGRRSEKGALVAV